MIVVPFSIQMPTANPARKPVAIRARVVVMVSG
jgi:hypothetical protein